jgi:DNA primase
MLKRLVDEVVLCFDSDTAGTQAAERSLDALLLNDLIVRVAEIPPGDDPDSLVRREGKEEFEKRIAAARDFFDYWIEHEVAQVDLASLGAKMRLARSLAETVSRVHDPFMRGQVANKVSARLGVPVRDFQALFPKQSRISGIRAEESYSATGGGPPRHDVAMLCLLALRDEAARDFLRQQNWREILAQVPDAEILVRILESDVRPDNVASLNAFMATLSATDEGWVSSWLLQRVPPNAGTMVEKWWLGIREGVLRRQLDVAKNRIRLPQLSAGELVNLQKEILDLLKELRELPKLSSASRIDG